MKDLTKERQLNLIKQIKECRSTRNNCDYLLEHSDCDDLINYIEELKQENQELKEEIKELELIVGLRQKRNLISKFDKEYDQEDKKKNPNRNYAGIMPDAEEVYKRYYAQREKIDKAIEVIKHIDKYEETLNDDTKICMVQDVDVDEIEIIEEDDFEDIKTLGVFSITGESVEHVELGLKLGYTGVSNTFNEVYFKINQLIKNQKKIIERLNK